MSDLGRTHGPADEDRLPWLEPVEEICDEEGVSVGRLIVGLLVALVALGLIVTGVYWLKQRATGDQIAGGEGDTIAAPTTPYKTRPEQPGGMQVKGQGDSSYAASEGADVNGQIDLTAVPETPVARPVPAPVPAVAPSRSAPAPAATATPPVATPAPAPAGGPVRATPAVPAAAAPVVGGSQVQLGAFSSQAKAEAAWTSLAGRFASLAPLSHSVTPSESNGRTVYRLRAAAGAQAATICGKLRVAGETCLVVG